MIWGTIIMTVCCDAWNNKRRKQRWRGSIIRFLLQRNDFCFQTAKKLWEMFCVWLCSFALFSGSVYTDLRLVWRTATLLAQSFVSVHLHIQHTHMRSEKRTLHVAHVVHTVNSSIHQYTKYWGYEPLMCINQYIDIYYTYAVSCSGGNSVGDHKNG